MKSLGNVTLGYKIFVFLVGLVVIVLLNFFFFAPYIGIGKQYGIMAFFLLIFLSILLFFLIKNIKYYYEITDKYLYIKTPRKKNAFIIPLTDINKVGIYKNIPFYFRVGLKYDFVNKILFLCGYTNKGIILKLNNFKNQIVISPRNFDSFLEELKKHVYKNK